MSGHASRRCKRRLPARPRRLRVGQARRRLNHPARRHPAHHRDHRGRALCRRVRACPRRGRVAADQAAAVLLRPASRALGRRRALYASGRGRAGRTRLRPGCGAHPRGSDPDVRKVMVGAQRVPYWQGGRAYEPYAMGYFGAFGPMTWMFMGGMMFGDFGGGGDGGGGDGGARWRRRRWWRRRWWRRRWRRFRRRRFRHGVLSPTSGGKNGQVRWRHDPQRPSRATAALLGSGSVCRADARI